MIVPLPPVGGVKATLTAVELDTAAETLIGGSGNVYVVVDALDATDIPPEFVAVIVNVYAVFADNPDTVIGEDEPVPIKPPGLLVTVYCVIVPFPLGAVKGTLMAFALVAVAVPIVGKLGFVVTELDKLDTDDVMRARQRWTRS